MANSKDLMIALASFRDESAQHFWDNVNFLWVLFYYQLSICLTSIIDYLYSKVNHCFWMPHLSRVGLYYAFFSLALSAKILVSSKGVSLKIFLSETFINLLAINLLTIYIAG